MKIIFEQKQGQCRINGDTYSIKDHEVIYFESKGWQLICFETDHDWLQISDIELNGISIQHLKFIMHDQNRKCTHGTVIKDHQVFMPVHHSYSEFRSTVSQQLTNGWYGEQIYDHHEFAIDHSVTFETDQPLHIRDYFARDMGAHWIARWNTASAWFYDTDVNIDQLRQIDHTLFEEDQPGGDTNQGWTMRNLKNPSVAQLRHVGLDPLADIAEQKKFTDIVSVSCNTLAPGGHIGIHIDGHRDRLPRKKIYFNLDPSDQVYFKFATVGLVPMNTDRGLWLNTDKHVHAVVNDTAQPRTIVSISGQANW